MVKNFIEITYNYGNGFRTRNQECLFLAKDVANWIENSNTSQMVRNIDEDEKVKQITPIYNVYNGQYENQECLFLTEDGLYEILMQSRKPIAKAFKKEVVKLTNLKGTNCTFRKLHNTGEQLYQENAEASQYEHQKIE